MYFTDGYSEIRFSLVQGGKLSRSAILDRVIGFSTIGAEGLMNGKIPGQLPLLNDSNGALSEDESKKKDSAPGMSALPFKHYTFSLSCR